MKKHILLQNGMSPRKAKFLIFPLPQEHPVISGVRNPIKFYLHTSKSRSYRSKPTGIQTLKNCDLSALMACLRDP